jgi:hypothetical protein
MYKILLFLFIPLLFQANDSVLITKNHNRYVKGKVHRLSLKDYVKCSAKWNDPNIKELKAKLEYCQYIIIDGDTFNYIDNNNKEQGLFLNILICDNPNTKRHHKNKNCFFTKEIFNYKNAFVRSFYYIGCDSNYNCDSILWEGDFSDSLPFVAKKIYYGDSTKAVVTNMRDSLNSGYSLQGYNVETNRKNGEILRITSYSQNQLLTGYNFFKVSDSLYMDIFVFKEFQNYLIELKDQNKQLFRRYIVVNRKIIKEECIKDNMIINCSDTFDIHKLFRKYSLIEILYKSD